MKKDFMNKKIWKTGFNSLFFPSADLPHIASDEQAFTEIWNSVGNDIKEALGHYAEEENVPYLQQEKKTASY